MINSSDQPMKNSLGLLILGLIVIPITVPSFAQIEDDDVKCGPGTIMKDGFCVLDESVEQQDDTHMEEPMEETPHMETQQEPEQLFDEIIEEPIPDWIRQTAGWWADELISDSEFVSAIEYLLERGIIQVSTPQEESLRQKIEQLEAEKAQIEADIRAVNDRLERIDDYLDSKAISIPEKIGTEPVTQTEEPTRSNATKIPNDGPPDPELAKIAGNWAGNLLNDQQFFSEIERLVSDGRLSPFSGNQTNTSQTVPTWVKNNAKWYSSGMIDNGDFLPTLEYLYKNGFIHNP